MKRYLYDIEGDNLLDDISVIHCIWIKDVDTGDVRDYGPDAVADGLADLETADQLIGHNLLGFDNPAIRKLHPDIRLTTNIFDTLVMAMALWPDLTNQDARNVKARKLVGMPGKYIGSHALGAWGHRLGVHKGTFGDNADWSTWTPEMHTYCGGDIETNYALWLLIDGKDTDPRVIEAEHAFTQHMHDQQSFGFPFNTKAAEELYMELNATKMELDDSLRDVFPPTKQTMKSVAYYTSPGGSKFATIKLGIAAGHKRADLSDGPKKIKETPFNPGSRPQVADRLIKKYGWTPTQKTPGGGVKIDDDILSDLEYPEAKQLATYYEVKKMISTLTGKKGWLSKAVNNRMHGRVVSVGCVTSRCAHSNPNMGNVPSMKTTYGKQSRQLFGPPEGWKQIGCDASGLELRMLAHYMARYDDGAYGRIVVNGDVHTLNQAAAGLDSRDDAKKFIYAKNYGAWFLKLGTIGWKPEMEKKFGKGTYWMNELMESANAWSLKKLDNKQRSQAARGFMLTTEFDDKTPAMATLISHVKETARERGQLTGLDGRILPVRKESAALNTLLQGAGAVVMKWALIIFMKDMSIAGFKVGTKPEHEKTHDFALLGNIHDEFQLAIAPDMDSKYVMTLATHSITESGELFNLRCPLAGEAKIGNNWYETH